MEASKILGCSNKLTMRLNEGCFLVLRILRSFEVREKKATSLPAKKKEITSRKKIEKIKIVVAAILITKKLNR